MKTALGNLDFADATTLSEALTLLASEPDRVPLAGCTDVYVGLNFGHIEKKRFVNIWSLSELRGISENADFLRIGALTTYTEMIESPIIAKFLPMMRDCARLIGGCQVQNRGTVGGNIANGSPAGDTLPILAVAEAMIIAQSLSGTRKIPFLSFYAGYRKTVLLPGELIVAIEIPKPPGAQWFRKVGTRAANAISKVVIAGLRGETVRLAFGSVGPTVIRARRTEAVLSSGGTIAQARDALAHDIHPIDDLRSTSRYRMQVAENLLSAFWDSTTPNQS
ncbi:MAG: FAD binding domain-containing protein [Myxococcales bacterium]|nr:FAD binding domain-containing protein [Myxococcales bacterium]